MDGLLKQTGYRKFYRPFSMGLILNAITSCAEMVVWLSETNEVYADT